MIKKVPPYLGILLFSLLISLPIILPFLHAGYFPTHDGEWAVVRLADMFRALRDFQIPARYSENLNFGYGYPLFNFAYPFPYYLGTFIHLMGVGFVDTIKVLFASSVFLSGFFMFLASRSLWKSALAGAVCSIMYIYFPYRMVDLYVRGSIGESLSFVLFPLLFYLGIKLVNKASLLLVGCIGVTVGILVMTHNIMSVLFLPIFIAFTFGKIILEKKKVLKSFISSILLGFGISAFFWIPALLEKSNILLSEIPIADRSLYFVNLEQLLLPKWGYGVPTDPNGFSYQFGLAHIAAFLLIIFFFIFTFFKNKKKLKDNFVKVAFLLTIATSIVIFFLFKYSAFLWENLPLLSEINYPWTLLAPIGFLISLSAGFLCTNKVTRYIMVALSICAILLVLPYAKPEQYLNKGDDYYMTNDATTTSSNELMPLWVKKMPTQRVKEKVEIISGKGVIENVSFNSKEVKFSAIISNESIVRINTIYYPGWKINVNGVNVPISYSNEKGVMDIDIPSGNHIVNAVFGETPLRLISNIISIASFLALLLVVLITSRKFLLRQ